MSYAERREAIYRPLREEGLFTWDWLYGQEYALADPVAITAAELDALREATARLGDIYAKTARVIQAGGDELLAELGLPAPAFAAVRLPFGRAVTIIGRFDFIRTPAGWKMLEFNADTPGGVVEAFHANSRVCTCHRVADPNGGAVALLREAFLEAAEEEKSAGDTVFSALNWHVEDAGTARYLLAVSGLSGRFVPLKDLRVMADRLCYSREGELVPIGLWYRLHPLGLLAEDRDEDGYPSGEHLLRLIADRRVTAINPPVALIAQTKALQALIWAMAAGGDFFDKADREAIATYMLPTYLENRLAGRAAYVTKPVLGREGGGITIYGSDGSVLCRDGEKSYWDQTMIYQQFAELETAEVETLAGPKAGRLIWGSFLVAGRPAAVNARLGGPITDDLAYFVPVRLAE